MNEKKERKLRNALSKRGYKLHKSRIKNINADNYGGYMIVDSALNAVIQGSKYELSLADIEAFISRDRG